MKVKAAYYLQSLPGKIAVILPDGSAKAFDQSPLREISAADLSDLAVLHQPAYLKMIQNEKNYIIAEDAYAFWGLVVTDKKAPGAHD